MAHFKETQLRTASIRLIVIEGVIPFLVDEGIAEVESKVTVVDYSSCQSFHFVVACTLM